MQNGDENESGAHAILGVNVEPSLGRPDSLEWFEYLDKSLFSLKILCGGFMKRNARLLLLVAVSLDRKSTRLNSSHDQISYAVFCLKKKKFEIRETALPRSRSAKLIRSK